MYRLCGFVNFGSSFKNTYTLKDQIESVQIVSYTDIPIKKIVEVVDGGSFWLEFSERSDRGIGLFGD